MCPLITLLLLFLFFAGFFFRSETIKSKWKKDEKGFLFIQYHKHVKRIVVEWKRWIKGLQIKECLDIR